MKYDLISQINDALQQKGGQLTPSMDKAIRIIQSQKFPELDGLRLYKIDYYIQEEKDSKIVTPPKIKLRLVTRHPKIYSLTASTGTDYKGNEFTDVEMIEDYQPSFYLTFTCDALGNLLRHGMNYVYGRDIICYSYRDNNNSVVDMKSSVEIYINVAKNEILKYENVKPLNLLPDIAYERIYKKNDYIFLPDSNGVYNTHEDAIRLCRICLNESANYYHQNNEDYMSPKKR